MRDTRLPSVWRIGTRILFTFARQRPFWLWSPVVIGIAAFVSSRWPLALILKGSQPDEVLLHDQLVISVIFLCTVCAHFTGFVTGHAARLIALPHNHVVPRLRGPAVGIAVGLTLLGILLPTLFWPRPLLFPDHGWFPLWAGAIVAVVAAEFAWVQVWPSLVHLGLLPSLIGTLPWLALTRPGARRALVEMLQGERPALAAGLYVVAALLLVILWLLLFHRRQLAAMGPLKLWPTCQPASTVKPWSHAHILASTPWRRFRLRTFLVAAGVRDGLAGAIGGAVLALGALFLQYLFGPGEAGTSLILSLVISILVPFIITTRAAEARSALLTFELMLPHSRREFVRGFGLAMLANLYSAWAAAQFGVLATYAVLDPADLRAYAGAFALVLPIAAAYQLFFFGMLAWHLSLRPTIFNGVVFFTLALIVIPVMAPMFHRPAFSGATGGALTALALLIGGGVLVFTALRRWTLSEIT